MAAAGRSSSAARAAAWIQECRKRQRRQAPALECGERPIFESTVRRFARPILGGPCAEQPPVSNRGGQEIRSPSGERPKRQSGRPFYRFLAESRRRKARENIGPIFPHEAAVEREGVRVIRLRV